MSLNELFSTEISVIDQALLSHFDEKARLAHPGYEKLSESIVYSLKSGGKRFRPLLSLLTAKSLGKPIEQALPVAKAVEFIHTYSLIHDDLPCMDDDDERRGQPTNHKVYGEGMALLAGDALLTEAFTVVTESYRQTPAIATEVAWLVSEAAGLVGMVGGQSMDVEVPEDGHSQEQIRWVHEMKTGALIRVSVEAAAVACQASPHERESLKKYADLLGFAFQLADDIDDYDPEKPESTSIVNVQGIDATRAQLNEVTAKCIQAIEGLNSKGLAQIALFNQERV
ncbi:MAG: geranyl transferase [Bdellovibrionaceae bacterium]|nr:geranyl transferase [Pseudobdellovibrionaceae bacterium]|tara:strand:+ start:28598 stop:29446 length:849 start_codon:yes stop_codon:yes gene_type:complete